jgi:hypothetical protein
MPIYSIPSFAEIKKRLEDEGRASTRNVEVALIVYHWIVRSIVSGYDLAHEETHRSTPKTPVWPYKSAPDTPESAP